jgi:hypothetical protein
LHSCPAEAVRFELTDVSQWMEISEPSIEEARSVRSPESDAAASAFTATFPGR